MTQDQIRLLMGEMTSEEARIAVAAYKLGQRDSMPKEKTRSAAVAQLPAEEVALFKRAPGGVDESIRLAYESGYWAGVADCQDGLDPESQTAQKSEVID